MKTFILISALFTALSFSASAHAAKALTCELEDGMNGMPENATLVVLDWLNLDCHNKAGDDYTVRASGIGAGLRIGGDGKFKIVCPLVRKHKLEGTYFGVKLSAGVMAGVDVAVMSNTRLGGCFLVGASLKQLGASVTIEKFEIKKN